MKESKLLGWLLYDDHFYLFSLWAHLSKTLGNSKDCLSKGWHLDYFKMTFLIFRKRSLILFQKSKTVCWPFPLNFHLPEKYLQQSAKPLHMEWFNLTKEKIAINFILIDSSVWCLEKADDAKEYLTRMFLDQREIAKLLAVNQIGILWQHPVINTRRKLLGMQQFIRDNF